MITFDLIIKAIKFKKKSLQLHTNENCRNKFLLNFFLFYLSNNTTLTQLSSRPYGKIFLSKINLFYDISTIVAVYYTQTYLGASIVAFFHFLLSTSCVALIGLLLSVLLNRVAGTNFDSFSISFWLGGGVIDLKST